MTDEIMVNLNFFDISVLNQTWEKGNAFSYEKSNRPYHGICFVISGRIRYKTAEKEYFAYSGDVVLLEKHSHYKAIFCEENTCDILINFQFQSEKNDFFDKTAEKIKIFKNRPDLKKNFTEILKYDMKTDRKCMVKSKLYEIADGLCNIKSHSEAFVKIKQAIDNDTEFKMKEADFAKNCFVSVSTLQRIFRKNHGKTISEYRNDLKIQKAKELLWEDRLSLEKIAEMLGFCDSAYFSKCFKKSTGVSPQKYKKQH